MGLGFESQLNHLEGASILFAPFFMVRSVPMAGAAGGSVKEIQRGQKRFDIAIRYGDVLINTESVIEGEGAVVA